ncbi:MAG: ParB/RepB/Spo0J family partition protein [Deltaproteobacteria bacterium]|jgi:ParB family chromosome partitioning protein|nr:ParB/RepB/Spo0J family partition protein [Deltaproteobacteria bacterium]
MSAGGKRQALGRGLAALIPSAGETGNEASPREPAGGGLRSLDIESIHPSARQPRKHFDDGSLDELADTIRNQGIIQPLVVRSREKGGFELVAGERRWRAAQRAGLHQVPAVVRETSESQAFEMALIENLQREDLNPIEEAEAFQYMLAEHGHTQESLSQRVGKDRSTVANALRLLKLPPSVRAMVREGRLNMGHARALLGLESDQAIERLARQTASRGLSVRQVETLVKRERDGDARPVPSPVSPAARDLVRRLEQTLTTRVKLVQSTPKRGRIEIHYGSLDELDAILAKILR